MRWKRGRRSGNIDDRRGQPAYGGSANLASLLPLLLSVGRRGGLGAVILIVVVLWVLSGGLQQFMGTGAPAAGTGSSAVPTDEVADFVSVILASTEDAWAEVFQEGGATYRPPELVLFAGQVRSACGFQTAATGPFYCPSDVKVYLDLGFFAELARLGGAGDFAAAYVVGHEVGHHVQNLLGTSDQVRQASGRVSREEGNALAVKLELQADCYAGVWANRTDRRGIVALSPGDVEEGLEAARAIGDDRLQRNAGRSVTPESFTHGTSEQRSAWLLTGLTRGELRSCDTFAGEP
jgi:predicted metalloprotease